MKKHRFPVILIILMVLMQGCTKNDPGNDLTSLTIGTRNIGSFTPNKIIAYKSLEGYIVELASDTITFTMLLPDIKPGSYSITNQNLSGGKAIFNIGFKQTAYSASEGKISITDTSNNSISGTYTVTNSTNGNSDPLRIFNGRFTKVNIESVIYGSVEDYEHNQYKTIEIGTQTWMAQNLRSWIYSSLNNATSGAFTASYYRTDMGFSMRCVKN